MKVIIQIILMGLLAPIWSASMPMESAKKTLYVLMHGINPSGKGLSRDCTDDDGAGGGTFHKNGATKYMRDQVANSFHNVYIQTAIDPATYPYKTARELGDRSWQTVDFDCQKGNSEKKRKVWIFNEDLKEIEEKEAEPEEEYRSMLEMATLRWFEGEVTEFDIFHLGEIKNKSTKQRFSEEAKRKRPPYEDSFLFTDPLKGKESEQKHFPLAYNGDFDVLSWLEDHYCKKGVDGEVIRGSCSHPISSAEALETLRQEKPELVPSRYVLVIHSMGGPVTREYIHSDYYLGDVDKVVTFDSPQEGSGIAASVAPFANRFELEASENKAAGVLSVFLLTIPEPITDNIGNALVLLHGTDLLGSFLATMIVGSKELLETDGGILYLTPGSDELKNINSKTSVQTGYPFPAHRIFHNEGLPSIGSVEEITTQGTLGDLLLPDVLQTGVGGFFKSLSNPYHKDIPTFQKWGNHFLAFGAGTLAGLNLAEQGTIAVPYWSSKAESVAMFSQPGVDVQRSLNVIKAGTGGLGTDLILGIAAGYAEAYVLMQNGSIGINTVVAANPTFGWIVLLKYPLSIVAAAAGFTHGLALVGGVGAVGQLENIAETGEVIGASHDINIINTHHLTEDKTYKRNRDQTEITSTSTLLEHSLYERPFVSFSSETLTDGSIQPQLFVAGENPEDPFVLTDPISESGLVEMEYLKSDIWLSSFGLKKTSFETVAGVDENNKPTIRRVNRFFFPEGYLVKKFPKEFHFTVDDVRPDLLKEFSVQYNRYMTVYWERIEDESNNDFGRYNVYRKKGINDPVHIAVVNSPIRDNGEWIFKTDDPLFIDRSSGENLSDVFDDGYNEVFINTVNKVGLPSFQKFSFIFQATPPFVHPIWPRPFTVISTATPKVEVLADLLSYQSIEFDASKTRFRVYPRNTSDLSANPGETVGWLGFDVLPSLTYPTQDLNNTSAVFSHTWSTGTPPSQDGFFWLDAEVATKTEEVKGKPSQPGAPHLRRVPFTIDRSAPALELSVPDHAINPNIKDAFLKFSFSDMPLATLKFARLQILNAAGFVVRELDPILDLASPVVSRLWDGKDNDGNALSNGEYTFKVQAVDLAVPDLAGQTLITKLDELFRVKPIIWAQIDPLWNQIQSPSYNITSAQKIIRLDQSAPQFALTNFEALLSKEKKQTLTFKAWDQGSIVGEFLNIEWSFKRLASGSLPALNLSIKQKVEITGSDEATATPMTWEEADKIQFEDGTYKISASIRDAAGNVTEFVSPLTFSVDRTAPKIQDIFTNQLSYSISGLNDGSEIPSGQWKVQEVDIPENIKLANISCQVLLRRPDEQKVLVKFDLKSQNGIFSTPLPVSTLAGMQGTWLLEIGCQDWVGNTSRVAQPLYVEERPPKISFPSPQNVLSGVVAVRGLAPNPFPTSGSAFQDYRLDWKACGTSSLWQQTGLSTPIVRRGSAGTANQSFSSMDVDGHLGDWNVSALLSGCYTLRLTTTNAEGRSLAVQQDYLVSLAPPVSSFAPILEGVPTEYSPDQRTGVNMTMGVSFAEAEAKVFKARLYLVDVNGQVLLEQQVEPLTTSNRVGEPSIWTGTGSSRTLTAPKDAVYFWQAEDGQWHIAVQNAPKDVSIQFLYEGGINPLEYEQSGSWVIEDKEQFTAKQSTRLGDLKADRIFRATLAAGTNGFFQVKVPSIAQMSGLYSSDADGVQSIPSTDLLVGQNSETAYPSNSNGVTPSFSVPLTISPFPAYHIVHWDGLQQNGSYPEAGVAQAVLEMEEQKGTEPGQIRRIVQEFEILPGTPSFSVKASPTTLKYNPQVGSPLGKIQFFYGVHGSHVKLTAGIRKVGETEFLYSFFSDKEHRAQGNPDAYSLAWNGLDKVGHAIDPGTQLEFVLVAKNAATNALLAQQPTPLPFGVEYAQWIDASLDPDLDASTFRLLVDNTSTDNTGLQYLQPEARFKVIGQATGSAPSVTDFNYDVFYGGSQKAIAYPTDRFSLNVMRKRDRFKAIVWVKLQVSRDSWFDEFVDKCVYGGRETHYVFEKRVYTFTKGESKTLSLMKNSSNRGRLDGVSGEIWVLPYENRFNVIPSEVAMSSTSEAFSDKVFSKSFVFSDKAQHAPLLGGEVDSQNCSADGSDHTNTVICNEDTPKYSPHKNMLDLSFASHSDWNSDYHNPSFWRWDFRYISFNKHTCNNFGPANVGFKLTLDVSDKYWNAPFGFNNWAVSSMRFDPLNQTLYDPLEGYLPFDDFDNNGDGKIDNRSGKAWEKESFGLLAPFQGQTFRLTPKDLRGNAKRNPLHFVDEIEDSEDKLEVFVPGSYSVKYNDPNRPLNFRYLINQQWCNNDIDANDKSNYECLLKDSRGGSVELSEFGFFGVKTVDLGNWHKRGEGLNVQNIFIRAERLQPVSDLANLRADPNASVSLPWPLTEAQLEAEQQKLLLECDNLAQKENCRRLYKAVSGARLGLKDGLENVLKGLERRITGEGGTSLLVLDPTNTRVDELTQFSSYEPSEVGLAEFKDLSGSLSIKAPSTDFTYEDLGSYRQANGILENTQGTFFAGEGVTIDKNKSRVVIKNVASGSMSVNTNATSQGGLRFISQASKSWTTESDPLLRNRDLDNDGKVDEETRDYFDELGDGDHTIDEDVPSYLIATLSKDKIPAKGENTEISLLSDLYVPSIEGKIGQSQSSLFWLIPQHGFRKNPYLKNVGLRRMEVQYLDGTPHDELTTEASPVLSAAPSDQIKIKISRSASRWDRAKELVEVRGVLPIQSTEGVPYRIVYVDKNGVLKEAFQGVYQKNNLSVPPVLGYIDLNRIQGNTSFFFLREPKDGLSHFRKLDVQVGTQVTGNNEATVVRSIYGDAEVYFPKGSFSEDKSVTVRITNIQESGLSQANNLSTIGPVVEVFPSHEFTGAFPQVRMTISRTELLDRTGGAEAGLIKLYKVREDGNAIVPLENQGYTFFSRANQSIPICTDKVGSCAATWDYFVISADTKSFSLFVALESSKTETRTFTFEIDPVIDVTKAREYVVDGLNKDAFDLYADDDALWIEDGDLTPPLLLSKTITLDEANKTKGVLSLPSSFLDGYVFLVPKKSNGTVQKKEVHVLDPNFTFSYNGPAVVYLGTKNGLLTMPYISTHPGDLELVLKKDQDVIGFVLQELKYPLGVFSWNGLINNQNLAIGEYQSLFSATSLTGESKQVLGPLIKMDGDLPSAELSGQVKNDVGNAIVQLNYEFFDVTSSIHKAELLVFLGDKILLKEVDVTDGNGVESIHIFQALLEECLGCNVRAELTVKDEGGNHITRTWISNPVYPLPGNLMFWYPMNEGYGKTTYDATTNRHHLGLSMLYPWAKSSGLYFSGAPDKAQSMRIKDVTIENPSELTIEWWHRGGFGNKDMPIALWKSFANGEVIDWSLSQKEENLIFQVGNSSAIIIEDVLPKKNLWYHIVLTFDGSTVVVYRNGDVFDTISEAKAFTLQEDGELVVGADYKSQHMIGSLSGLRLYNGILVASTVKDLYDFEKTIPENLLSIQAEDGVRNSLLTREISCELPSLYYLKNKSSNTEGEVTLELQIPKTGTYYLFGKSWANVVSESKFTVMLDGTSSGSWNIPTESRWGNHWWQDGLSGSESPKALFLTAGIHQIKLQFKGDIRLDWIALTEDNDLNISKIEARTNPKNEAKVAVQIKEQVWPLSGMSQPQIRIINLTESNINGYSMRYYFNEDLSDPVIGNAYQPSGLPVRVVTIGERSAYAELDLPNKTLTPEGPIGASEDIMFALRHLSWSPWYAQDDPSSLETISSGFQNTNGIPVFDTSGNLISDWKCFEEEPENNELIQAKVVAKLAETASINSSHVQVYVENIGKRSFNNFKVRYYYTVDEGLHPEYEAYYHPQASITNVHVSGNQYYIELNYAKSLNPGQKTDWGTGASFELHYSSWTQSWNTLDDPSSIGLNGIFNDASGIVLLDEDGNVLWGNIPVPAEPIEELTLNEKLGFEGSKGWLSENANIEWVESPKTDGDFALKVQVPNGWGWIESEGLDFKNHPLNATKIELDFKPALSSDQYWKGNLSLTMSIPSKNMDGAWIGQVDVSSLTDDVYQTISLNLPSHIQTALGSKPNDVKLKWVLSVPAGAGSYHFDSIQFK